MKKEELKKLIDTAAGRIPADTVIKNCQIVNVLTGSLLISGQINLLPELLHMHSNHKYSSSFAPLYSVIAYRHYTIICTTLKGAN